jgi:hypothetical protein
MKVTSNLFFYTNETLWGCGESLVHCNFLLILWGSSWLIDFIPFFKVATKEFSFDSTPNTLLFLSGFARQMRSTTEFAMTVLSKCVCVYVCVGLPCTVANHASPWFNRGGPGAWLRHDLGPGQLPGSLPTCHCQVQHQVGHACQARGGQCWEEDGESNVMDGSEKWTDLKGFFCPDTRQIPAIEQDTVPDYGCIVIPGVFWHTQRATFVRRAPPTVKLICIYIYKIDWVVHFHENPT